MNVRIVDLPEKANITGTEVIPIDADVTSKVTIDTIKEDIKEYVLSQDNIQDIQSAIVGTYQELKELRDSSLLIPGHSYIMTDYRCSYSYKDKDGNIQYVLDINDGWVLMLKAISEKQFSVDVNVYFTSNSSYVLRGGIPIIECKYQMDNTYYEWVDPVNGRGVIFYMKDSHRNECEYDFKHVKFIRYAVTNVGANETVGTATKPSAFRCFGTAVEPKRSDGRTWIGSGLDIEANYIKSIFAGTFTSEVWGQAALHENYISRIHKPFLSGTTQKYLAWTPNMNTEDGIGSHTAAIPSMIDIEVDDTDYVPMYTFDYYGTDASNLCYNNVIKTTKGIVLPNIVINISEAINADRVAQFSMNTIVGQNSTFSIHNFEDSDYVPTFMYNTFNRVNNCLFQFLRMYYVHSADLISYSYLSGSMYNCTFDMMSYSVLFGYYNSINCKNSSHNLLFGQEMQIINASGNYASPADGNYWYDDEIQEWFGYNIMAPFQYALFYPHTNTNFVRLPYNKGVTLMGTFQDNYVERMRWGVEVSYGAVQGNYMGELTRTTFSSSALVTQVAHSSGVSSIYKLQGATKWPNLTNCLVKTYQISRRAFSIDSATETKLAETGQTKLVVFKGNTLRVKYFNEL